MSIKQNEIIQVGDYLPFAPRFNPTIRLEQHSVVVVEDEGDTIKKIGLGKRIMIVGVIGAFTPDCWNHHLFQVIHNADYYMQHEVEDILVLATNDFFVLNDWAEHLNLQPPMRMVPDTYGRVTKCLGMGIVMPRISNSIRCRRFVMLVDNMLVKQLSLAPDTGSEFIRCVHIVEKPIIATPRKPYKRRFRKEEETVEVEAVEPDTKKQ